MKITYKSSVKAPNYYDRKGFLHRTIKESIDKITRSTENVLKRFELIDSSVKTVSQEITCGMNETASGADQINAAVHNVSELSNKNREGIDS
jgi:methyl-accepting chemotaxis protein